MLATCPVMPPFHSKHGEPIDDRNMFTDHVDAKAAAKMHITDKSTYLLTRMDTFKIDHES